MRDRRGWGGGGGKRQSQGLLTLHGDHDERLVAGAGLQLEGPQLHVGLHDGICELAADQALGIEDLSHKLDKGREGIQRRDFTRHNSQQ